MSGTVDPALGLGDASTITETEVISHDDEDEQTPHPSQQLKGKKLSWQKLRRSDSLDIESGKLHGHHGHASKGAEWSVILHLAFQSIGIVYGDIGTSPLYVYASTFTDGIKNNDDILGVLSLIFYTLTLIPLIKYVLIVLRANDNGDGGTFALYSLICRYAKVGLIPSQEAEDRDVSTFQLELPNNRVRRASKLKSRLENSRFAKFFLLFATMLGTSMVIGDGVLTPCISVLSAVGGIKEATSAMTQDRIVWVSVGILVFLFMVQRFGTDKVGYSFAPIICVWFCFIGGIGIYNFFKYDPTVVKAINPAYIVNYFQRNKKQAWISLGGIVLAITGTEALFADVGHFTVRSIQISMCSVTYPALILAYTGQASFLRKHNDLVSDTFFKSIPKSLYWPMFVVAVAASIIASQAMISGTFSIIQQSLSMGCFPRVKIVHTSAKYEGQVYIPEVNYLLMIACVAVTVGFRTTTKIGNAYGIAVVFVMTLTSSFLVLIMIMIWKTHILLVVSYVLVIGSVELLYLSSVLYKFDQGGYLPLAFAMVLMAIMYIWNDVYRKKYYYELDHKISPEKLKEIASETNFCRMPGLAIFYSELVHGIPPIFKHYVANVPALHSVLVFVSIKSLPISKVPVEERFLFRRVDPHDLYVFRCVVRYGYTDVRNEEEPFERLLLERLKEYIRDSFAFSRICAKNDGNEREREEVEERKRSLFQNSTAKTIWDLTMSSNRIPGRCFVKLSDVTHFVGRMIDIYGVVVESSIPRASLGTDYVTTLKIIDPSQQNPEIGVNFFAESVDQLPRVRSHKDLLFLLSVKIENKRDVLTAVYQKKWTSFALLDGRDVNDFSPYQSCRFYMLSSDRAYIRQLRSWGQSFAFDAGRSDYVRLLKDLNPASSFVDLVCQVLYICQTPNEGWTLYVWDGTDAPSLKFNTILLDEERRPPPLQIEQTPLPNHVLCSFPLVGTVLRVSVDRSYISVGDYFEGTGLRSWVRIRNLLVSTYAGLWKGKIGPSTKIRPLSNADNSVVERLRCWEARTTLGRMPSASILLSNTITVTSHENVEPVSLMDIRAFSHTISQDSGRFRCIVRVISICPSQVKDFRSPREQVYRIRMTLEDPTARIEAILTGGDGEMFFKGYSSMESISSKMKSLLGMDCEGGERNPPWTPFCVDLRNHPIPGECVLGVHFHVTDTWLVYGNPQVPPLEVLDWE